MWPQADLEFAAAESGGQLDGVVMSYIEHPLLVHGLKFDLRLYVLVTSCTALTVYIHQEGRRASTRRHYTIAWWQLTHRELGVVFPCRGSCNMLQC